jgi:hypothetical protein
MQEGQRHQRIVQVRNPWATSEFKGYDWAQHLPTEIATSAEKSSVSTSGGGVFWLEWDLFLTFFRSVTVCKVMKNAFQHSAITTCAPLQGFVPDGLKATANKTKLSKAVYRITAEHKTWAHVSALQPSQRGYTAPPHKYASIGLLVSSSVAAETDIDSDEEDSEDEELALALALSKGLAVDTVPVTPPQQASKPEEDGKAVERKAAVLEGITFPRNIRHAELSVLLLPGRVYEVTAFCFEGPSRMPLVLSAYTQTEVEIQVSERSTAADSQDFPRLLNDGVAQHRQTQRTPCLDMLTRQPSGLFCNVLRQGHVVILQAVNTCNTGKACMTSCRESTGVAFSRGGSICRDLIPAQSKQILMICTVLDQYKGYTFKHSCGTVELVVECREHHSPALASLRDVHTPVFS